MNLNSAFSIANKNQLIAATENLDQSLVIVAAPGSGKTLTLTLRIAYLLNSNIDPKHIFAVTFTRKAASEMKRRLCSIIPPHIDIDELTLGTFHHCALNILRANAGKAGITWDFKVMSGKKQKKVLEEVLNEFLKDNKFEDLVHNNLKPLSEEQLQVIVEDIEGDNRKSSLKLPQGGLSYVYNLICSAKINRNTLKSLNRKFFWVFDAYNKKLRENKAIDLPDILFMTTNMLAKCPEVLKAYQSRYKYIIVDEFQDTNSIQLEFIQLLGTNSFVTVCGDDDQAIYGWRGASNEVFQDFRSIFPSAYTVILNQNYRSTQNIVLTAMNLITKNKSRDPKEIFSNGELGTKPEVIVTESPRQEACIIYKMIQGYIKQGLMYKDIAILYRLHRASNEIISELHKQNIPIRTKSKQVVLDKNEIGVISYLRVICSHDDEEAFMNVFNWPKRGLGDSSKLRLKNTSSFKNMTLFQSLDHLAHNYTGKNSKGFIELYNTLHYFEDNVHKMTPRDVILKILSIFNIKYLNQLIKLSEKFEGVGKETLNSFLQSLDYCQDPNVVCLSSIHQAKGQEWNIVFLIRVNEGVLPAGDDIQEERRLAYVAATRAKKILVLTCTMSGNKGECTVPSRFIDEFFEPDPKTKNSQTESKEKRIK